MTDNDGQPTRPGGLSRLVARFSGRGEVGEDPTRDLPDENLVRTVAQGTASESGIDTQAHGSSTDNSPDEAGAGLVASDEGAGMTTPSGTSQNSPAVGKHEELNRVLVAVRRSIPELHGAMIASVDGLPVAHDFPDADADRVAAMAATALGLGKRISERTNLGVFQEAVVRGDSGYMVAYAAGQQAVLVMSGPSDSNLGLMRIEARAASVMISRLLG